MAVILRQREYEHTDQRVSQVILRKTWNNEVYCSQNGFYLLFEVLPDFGTSAASTSNKAASMKQFKDKTQLGFNYLFHDFKISKIYLDHVNAACKIRAIEK
jgi:hypothetical protein